MAVTHRRRALILILAAGGAIALVAAVAFPAAGSASKGAPGARFTLYQHDTSQQYVDLGDAGPSVGDQYVFGGDVSDTLGGPAVGRMAGQCTTSSDTEILCAASFTIGGDQIAYQGIAETATFYGGEPTPFAVTGGTGRFRKASGTLTGRILPAGSDAEFVVDLC
jgi:hypothetical protein